MEPNNGVKIEASTPTIKGWQTVKTTLAGKIPCPSLTFQLILEYQAIVIPLKLDEEVVILMWT